MKKQPLTLKDFTDTFICIGIGLTLATGLFCLVMGVFYNSELNNELDKIDGIEKLTNK